MSAKTEMQQNRDFICIDRIVSVNSKIVTTSVEDFQTQSNDDVKLHSVQPSMAAIECSRSVSLVLDKEKLIITIVGLVIWQSKNTNIDMTKLIDQASIEKDVLCDRFTLSASFFSNASLIISELTRMQLGVPYITLPVKKKPVNTSTD